MSDALIGTWHLVEWTAHVGDDAPRYPFGEAAYGRITYTAEGRVWAVLMRPDRAPLGADSLAGATEADRARAAAGYIAYGGTYRLEGNEVVHTVEHSLLPNWIGTELRRTAAFEPDGRLTLTTPEERSKRGRSAHHRLIWRRGTP